MQKGLKKTNEIEIVFWTHKKSRGEEKQVYLFQFESSSLRLLSRVRKQIGGFVAGEGYNPRTNTRIIILRRVFETVEDFREFRKRVSFKFRKVKS